MPNPNETAPRKKTGPKPPGGVNRVKVTVWLSPAALAQLRTWTAESQQIHASASDGGTVELMVDVCKGTLNRPVLTASPAATPSSP